MKHPYQIGSPGNPEFSADPSRARAMRKGSAFDVLGLPLREERCVVRSVHPDKYSCDVYTTSGRYLAGVAWPGGSQEASAPRPGDTFGVSYGLGVPQLFEAATTVEPPADTAAFRVTPARGYGAEDPVYRGKGTNPQRGERPSDVMAGDWIRTGDLGNLVGVLSGGMTVVKAGELAQLVATQARNLVRLVGQNLQIFTGAGSIECVSEEGKTSLVMRLGADSATESTPAEENFRIRCDLGDTGELVDFRVTDGQGRDLYRVHVDPDGRVQRVAERETVVLEQDRVTVVGTDDGLNVKGDQTIRVGGRKRENVEGSRDVRAGGASRFRSVGDTAISSMHDMSLFSARFLDVKVGGQAVGTGDAMKVAVANGDLHFDVGNPSSGDTQVRRSGFRVNTLLGDISMTTLAGSVRINTSVPGNVKVGGPGPGIYSAVLFEQLRVWAMTFGVLIDTHFHPQPALGGSPTGPPVVAPWIMTQGLFELARSNFVRFGG